MRTDRRTHMTKLIVAFRNFVNAPKNVHLGAGTTTQCQQICCDVIASGQRVLLFTALAITMYSVKTSHIFHHHWNVLINLSCRFMKPAVSSRRPFSVKFCYQRACKNSWCLLVGDQLDAQFFYIIRLFQSSTCFDQTRAHHQEVSCINTASGIVTLCLVCRSRRNCSTCTPDSHLLPVWPGTDAVSTLHLL